MTCPSNMSFTLSYKSFQQGIYFFLHVLALSQVALNTIFFPPLTCLFSKFKFKNAFIGTFVKTCTFLTQSHLDKWHFSIGQIYVPHCSILALFPFQHSTNRMLHHAFDHPHLKQSYHAKILSNPHPSH